ncbi:MAG: MFS transporter [Actinobacteria bacterium]|nr:MFS transporter [Actinomycetota bacterium]
MLLCNSKYTTIVLVLLFSHPDFRRAYLANAVSQLGNAFQFVALMWFAVAAAGPLGVVAVRLVDGLPALLFGLHGGVAADSWDRKRTMIAADLVRGIVLVPVAAAGIAGSLPLWALVVAAFVVTTAASYFTPAFGAFLPSIVGRASIQRASSLVGATNGGLQTTGWAVAAALLGLVSVGTFFAINAASFFVSALLLWRIEARPRATVIHDERRPRLGGGLAGLRRRTGLPVAVAMLGAGMTIMSGVWTVGIAELAHSTLDLGAAGLALLLAATALGTISAAAFLTRRAVRRKVLASCLAWTIALPGYVLLGLASSLPLVLLGTFFVGAASSAAILLVSTATQESLPDDLLGRGMGVVFLGHVGTKPLGLIAIGPLYAVVDPAVIFVAGGLVVFAAALVSASIVHGATVRANLARATA